MKDSKPICSLSLDLDNQWSYMKTHGDAGWESFPSYLDLVVPRFLKIFDELGWKITVFVVGQDAAHEKNHEALQMIAAAGHEIGNHSFNHEPWLHLYSRQQVEDEIIRAEEAIEAATGQRPRGFRGPGYSLSRDVLEVLSARNYLYDASILPTFIGPLARAYYFLNSRFSTTDKHRRRNLFGGIRQGFHPNQPYLWRLNQADLLEVPVTTMPLFRLPIHFSYGLFISTFSPFLSDFYFRSALQLCLKTNLPPSLILHPLDLIGRDEFPVLNFFPGMNIDKSLKTHRLRNLLRHLQIKFDGVSMLDLGDSLLNDHDSNRLRIVPWKR